jgi:hypothetical protein
MCRHRRKEVTAPETREVRSRRKLTHDSIFGANADLHKTGRAKKLRFGGDHGTRNDPGPTADTSSCECSSCSACSSQGLPSPLAYDKAPQAHWATKPKVASPIRHRSPNLSRGMRSPNATLCHGLLNRETRVPSTEPDAAWRLLSLAPCKYTRHSRRTEFPRWLRSWRLLRDAPTRDRPVTRPGPKPCRRAAAWLRSTPGPSSLRFELTPLTEEERTQAGGVDDLRRGTRPGALRHDVNRGTPEAPQAAAIDRQA